MLSNELQGWNEYTFFHKEKHIFCVLVHRTMNTHSDSECGDQMMTHQQIPAAQAGICSSYEPYTANEPFHSAQGQLC